MNSESTILVTNEYTSYLAYAEKESATQRKMFWTRDEVEAIRIWMLISD